jgi:hypothetical protein
MRIRFVGLVALLLWAAGCDNGPTTIPDPNYREPMINGYVYKVEYYDGSTEYDKDVEVFDQAGLRMVPRVLLNDAPLEIYYYGTTVYRYGDGNHNPVLTKYELDVEHFWGSAFARVTLPGDFDFTGPRGDYIMGMESTLVVTWQRSHAAQWYWVSLVADYDYLDSLGEWDNREFRIDTLILDTFLILPPERVFPDFVVTVTEGDALATIWSGNGPAVEPGDKGNVRGIGFGFFNAVNEPMERYFYVGAPPRLRRCPGQREEAQRFLARLRQRVTQGR